MKLDRIMWGIILLFVGGVLLLENFNVIDFYWRSIWRFWPVFLIIAGINILFYRRHSQIGAAISIGVLVVMLSFLFYKGQQPPEHKNWVEENFNGDNEVNNEEEDGSTHVMTFSEPFNADSAKQVVLNVSGGGTSFELKGATDSLISAEVNRKNGNYSLMKEMTDSTQTLTFKMKEGKGKWSMNEGGNAADFRLNTAPIWTINMSMGAGEVDFDLTEFKVRTFKFDGGAAAVDVKLGDSLPITDVIVKTGVADVNFNIPETSGCRIVSKTGLSSKNFTGFTKINNDTYETPNFKGSTKKIFINFDGGLSSFEVKRY
jgi:hypothetical protein